MRLNERILRGPSSMRAPWRGQNTSNIGHSSFEVIFYYGFAGYRIVRTKMDFKHYTDVSVDLAVDLVNAFSDGAGTLAELRGLLGPHMQSLAGLSAGDLPAVRKLAVQLRDVFTASEPEAAAAILNGLLDRVNALPQLVAHDGEDWHLHFAPPGATPQRLLAATTAMGLAIVITEHGMDRLGVCDADTCADVYVDTSRNRSRRYCSLTCSNRANVAAHRARQRAARG